MQKVSVGKILENISSYNANRIHLKFALMVALMNATYKAVLCIVRHLVKEKPDRIGAALGGILAGLWISLIESKGQRNFIACLVISRLVDTLMNRVIQNSYLSKHNLTLN